MLVAVGDTLTEIIWTESSEVIGELLTQECELSGARDGIEVQHICELADLERINAVELLGKLTENATDPLRKLR